MRRGFWALALLFACCAPLAFPAFAGTEVTVLPGEHTGSLVVSGKLVVIFHTANAGLTPQQRAELAAERLRTLIASGLNSEQIEARPRGEGWAVYAAQNSKLQTPNSKARDAQATLLMIATPEEAAERHEEPEATARRWAANLRKVLGEGRSGVQAVGRSGPDHQTTRPPDHQTTRPDHQTTRPPVRPASRPAGKMPALPGTTHHSPLTPPKVEDHSLAVPLGAARSVPVSGGGALAVRVDDEKVASARVTRGRSVEVRGLVAGHTVVRVGSGPHETAFNVWVKPYAGHFGAVGEAEVTGSSAPASLVRRAAVRQVLHTCEREPGAALTVTGDVQGLKPLTPGESTEVILPVQMSGEAYLPVRTVARVKVVNLALPDQPTRSLLYSNDPESVREFGTLYQGLVESGGPVRLLYHHQNRMGRPLVFQVHLLNPSDAPASVQVVQADAGPADDPIQVGHRAGQRYLAAAMEDVGFVEQVPARGSRLVYSTSVPDLQTVSGIYTLRLLSGGPLVAHVSVDAAVTEPAATDEALAAARSEPHTYSTPQKEVEYRYSVGDRWAFVPLGRKAIQSKGATRTLYGNYGVLYNIKVDLFNPTNEVQTVRVLMSPDAGWARGVFVIEGKLVEAPQIAPPAEALLWTVKLAPQQQKQLSIQGLPVGGSNYPISLVVRS